MIFLAMITAWILFYLWGGASRVQHDGMFREWRERVSSWSLAPSWQLAVTVLLPVALAQLLFNSLAGVLFGLLWFGLATLVLLYSFGRGDYRGVLQRYQEQCRSGDFEAAWLAAGSEAGWADPQDDPVTPQDVHALVQRRALYEGYQRWFPALFYFMCLGPAGALAYRLLHLCRGSAAPELVERCLFFADWLPVRLLVAAFALTGDFVRSRDVLLDGISDGSVAADELLYRVAGAAAGTRQAAAGDQADFPETAARESEEYAGLISRSATCWVLVIALLVMVY